MELPCYFETLLNLITGQPTKLKQCSDRALPLLDMAASNLFLMWNSETISPCPCSVRIPETGHGYTDRPVSTICPLLIWLRAPWQWISAIIQLSGNRPQESAEATDWHLQLHPGRDDPALKGEILKGEFNKPNKGSQSRKVKATIRGTLDEAVTQECCQLQGEWWLQHSSLAIIPTTRPKPVKSSF